MSLTQPPNPAQHLWLTGGCQADRRHLLERLELPPEWLPPISANRRLRGPYTAAGTILRAVAPEAHQRWPSQVQRHLVELLSVAPELSDVVPSPPSTLTSLAVPGERTRYYSAARTMRIANGIAGFLNGVLRHSGMGRRSLVIDDLHHADYTDQELVGVLVRRIDPELLVIVAGSQPVFRPRAADSADETHPPAAGLPAALSRYCQRIDAPAAPPAPASGASLIELAQEFVASDGTDDRPEPRAAYQQVPDPERRRLHDERAAQLRAFGEASWAWGAIPYHLMRGTDPLGAGVRVIDAGLNHCMRMGFYDATIEFCQVGLNAADWDERPDLWWRFTVKQPTVLSALGRGDDAEAVCEAARTRTTDPEHHHQLAYATAMLYTRHLAPSRQDHERATGWANVAIAIASQMPDVKRRALFTVFYRNGLALVEAHRGRPERALQLVTDGIAELDAALAPDEQALHRSVLRHNRAQVLTGLKRFDEALADYRAVIEIDPHYPEYHFDVANLLHRLGRDEEALAEYDTAARLGPPFLEVYYNRAEMLVELGRLDEAVAAFGQVLELNPAFIDAYVNRAGILADLGEAERAAEDVRQGLELAPTNPHLLALHGRLELEAGRYEQARTALDSAIEAEPGLPGAWALRGAVHFDTGALIEALADLDRAAELDPNPTVLFNRGSAALALGRWAAAERDFSTVIEADPDEPDGWLRRAECRRELGDPDGARTDAQAFRRLAPEREPEVAALLSDQSLVSTES
jgi:tetratricopeptide (TPR) repeat protein